MSRSRRTLAAVYGPTMDPRTFIGCVRACVQDNVPIHQDLLRSLMPDADSILMEFRRADWRRLDCAAGSGVCE